jgi:hypothetical protein
MNESTLKALQTAERALVELRPSHRPEGCWCAWGYENRLRHSHRCRRAAEALALVRAELSGEAVVKDHLTTDRPE